MSLLYKRNRTLQPLTQIQRPSPKQKKSTGFAQSLPNDSLNTSYIEGTSLLIFRNRSLLRYHCRAGMTVEAALVLPLFLFFFLYLCSAMEMIRLHGNLTLALRETGNQLSVYAHALTWMDEEKPDGEGADGWVTYQGGTYQGEAYQGEIYQGKTYKGETDTSGMGKEESVKGETSMSEQTGDIEWQERLAGVALSYGYVRGQIVNWLGESYLDSSPLTGGAAGLQFLESSLQDGDYLEIVVTYGVSPPGGLLPFRSFRMGNRYYGHLWNGYQLPGEGAAGERVDIVYVTKYGTVYHERRDCTYISLSVHSMSLEEARAARNQYGTSYTLCGRCGEEQPGALVYLTQTGDRYHYSSECSSLQRIVTAILRSQAQEKGYTPCQRCGGAAP